MHPRTIIRHKAGHAIVNGIPTLDGRVYLSRATAVNAQMMPCVCVYTKSDRTVDMASRHVRAQEVDLVVEVFTSRRPDDLPWKKLPWLPNHAGQTFDADDLLDEACEALEAILYDLFSGRSVVDISDPDLCVFTEMVSEINTDIDYTADGEVPFAKATLTLRIKYQHDFSIPPQTCDFLGALLSIDALECNDGNPAPDGDMEAQERANIRTT